MAVRLELSIDAVRENTQNGDKYDAFLSLVLEEEGKVKVGEHTVRLEDLEVAIRLLKKPQGKEPTVWRIADSDVRSRH